MMNILDREDRVLRKRALVQLDKWLAEHLRKKKPAHPFFIVGENKGKQHDRRQNKNH